MYTSLVFAGGSIFGAVVLAFLLRRTVRRELTGPIPRQRDETRKEASMRRHPSQYRPERDTPPGFAFIRWFSRWR